MVASVERWSVIIGSALQEYRAWSHPHNFDRWSWDTIQDLLRVDNTNASKTHQILFIKITSIIVLQSSTQSNSTLLRPWQDGHWWLPWWGKSEVTADWCATSSAQSTIRVPGQAVQQEHAARIGWWFGLQGAGMLPTFGWWQGSQVQFFLLVSLAILTVSPWMDLCGTSCPSSAFPARPLCSFPHKFTSAKIQVHLSLYIYILYYICPLFHCNICTLFVSVVPIVSHHIIIFWVLWYPRQHNKMLDDLHELVELAPRLVRGNIKSQLLGDYSSGKTSGRICDHKNPKYDTQLTLWTWHFPGLSYNSCTPFGSFE